MKLHKGSALIFVDVSRSMEGHPCRPGCEASIIKGFRWKKLSSHRHVTNISVILSFLRVTLVHCYVGLGILTDITQSYTPRSDLASDIPDPADVHQVMYHRSSHGREPSRLCILTTSKTHRSRLVYGLILSAPMIVTTPSYTIFYRECAIQWLMRARLMVSMKGGSKNRTLLVWQWADSCRRGLSRVACSAEVGGLGILAGC